MQRRQDASSSCPFLSRLQTRLSSLPYGLLSKIRLQHREKSLNCKSRTRSWACYATEMPGTQIVGLAVFVVECPATTLRLEAKWRLDHRSLSAIHAVGSCDESTSEHSRLARPDVGDETPCWQVDRADMRHQIGRA